MLADFGSEEAEANKIIEEEQEMIKRLEQDKMEMAKSRKAEIGDITTNNV